MTAREPLLQVATALQQAQSILIVSHIRPDGDAIGSLLGLGLALQDAGKQVQMVLADKVPASLRHLPGSEQIQRKPAGNFDLVCVLDCSELSRAGAALEGRPQPDLNIDHHRTNLDFARINYVDLKAVATAEMVAAVLQAVGLVITQPVATALITGLITDTIGFRTSNMTPGALRLAAALMDTGINMPELYRKALVNKSFEAVRLWGAGLGKIKRDGQMAWTTLTLADRRAAGYPGRDDADLVNVLSAVDGVDVSLIFIEESDGCVKVSWRSQPGFDVSGVALSFGGGGHPAASGAEITGDLEEVQNQVLERTRLLLNGGHHV